jgi:hypothetical protein
MSVEEQQVGCGRRVKSDGVLAFRPHTRVLFMIPCSWNPGQSAKQNGGRRKALNLILAQEGGWKPLKIKYLFLATPHQRVSKIVH